MFPTGTVTFLFTDIEGSTSLAQQYPNQLPLLLARHNEILNQVIKAHNGYIFQLVGDSYAVAFHSAQEALAAALEAQRMLHSEVWDPASIRVRMGLHTGAANADVNDNSLRGYEGYFTIARAQRVMSVAHGGQVLLSNPTAEIMRDDLPPGVTLRDMGEYHLKSLVNPEHLWQIVAMELQHEFPPLKTISVLTSNLPLQISRLIGRERELTQISELLTYTRLLTLTGLGGIGKTRLAIGAAEKLLSDFPQGIWFVSLESLTSSEFLVEAIGVALGLPFSGQAPSLDHLLEFLRQKDLLLVLDNFEHLLPQGTKLVVEILHKTPGVKLLVTSRERLNLKVEWVLEIQGLDYPKKGQQDTVEAYPAAELFLQNAYRVTGRMLPAEELTCVGHIARLVEGAPLALEIAAAWTRTLSCQDIVDEIEKGLDFLQARESDFPERHRNMRAVFSYSWQLLSDEERSVYRKLSVFRGGFDCEAARQVAESSLDNLASLVDKSLIRLGPNQRYQIHELLRQFAVYELEQAGEAEITRELHLAYYLALAEQAEPNLRGKDRNNWLVRLDADHDNLMEALQPGQVSIASDEMVLRLAGALALFWFFRGYISEGRVRSETALKRITCQGLARAKALHSAGGMAWIQGDYVTARFRLEESVKIFREEGDRRGLAVALCDLGSAVGFQGARRTAISLYEESVQLLREEGDRWSLALSLALLGYTIHYQGDDASAHALFGESRTLFQELQDGWGLSYPVIGIGLIACRQANYKTALSCFQEASELRRSESNPWDFANVINLLGEVYQRIGELEMAASLYKESLVLDQLVGDKAKIALVLHNLGSVAQGQGQPERALRLFAASKGLRSSITRPFTITTKKDRAGRVDSVRSILGEQLFATIRAEGQAMTLDEAIEYALEPGSR
jgi:predicted ATPase/class 3 adenylate cyclase